MTHGDTKPGGAHQSTSSDDEQQVSLSDETHKVGLTDVWSTTSVFFLLFFLPVGLLVFTPSCQSSFNGGNLVFNTDGLCNYVRHTYRLLCKMPLKHLHSAKVHIRVLHLAVSTHNH